MKTFFKLIIIIPVISSLITAIIFMGLGVYEIMIGINGVFLGLMETEATPALRLFVSIDLFLIGFLFLIFALGFTQLFIPKPSKIVTLLDGVTPNWLKVETFTELKLILWDTVLTTLVLTFIGEVIRTKDGHDWQLTIIPISILFISFAKYLIKKKA